MIQRSLTLAMTLAGLTLLTACGGTDAPPADTLVLATDDSDTLAARIAANTPFPARVVKLEYQNPAGGALREYRDHDQERATYRLVRTDSASPPTIIIEQGGTATTFGPDEWAAAQANNAGSWAYERGRGADRTLDVLWTWQGDPREHADGTAEGRYHVPVGRAGSSTPTDDFRRYAVIGLATPTLPTDATASYAGYARLDLFPKGPDGTFHQLESDVTLTADFTAGTLQGSLKNWREWRGGQAFPDLAYDLTAMDLDGTPYTGTLAPAPGCTACPQVVSSAAAGTFYGPAAAETAGTLTVELDNTAGLWAGEPNSVGIGIFSTTQPAP